MPWCPKCRQEYMATARRCADCEVDLVADLSSVPPPPAAPEEARAGRIVTILAPPTLLATLGPWLEQARIPARKVEAAGGEVALAIPAAHAERVAAALQNSSEIEHDGDQIRVLGPATDREAELPADPAIVGRSLDELAADPSGLLPKVLALFATNGPRPRRWAREQLLALQERGVVALGDLLIWLVRGGYRRPLFGLVDELAGSPPAGAAVRLAAELDRLDALQLTLALHALARLPDPAVAPSVLPLLRHDDAEVRAEADEVLMSVSGIDVRFDAEAEPRAREAAIRQWREWIEQRA